MPAMSSMTLNGVSGADHVFVPFQTVSGGGEWVKPGSTPLGDERLSVTVNQTKSGRYVWKLKLYVPKTQDVTVGGVTTQQVARRGYVNVEVSTDTTHTAAEVGELLDLLRSALAEDENQDAISETFVFRRPFYA